MSDLFQNGSEYSNVFFVSEGPIELISLVTIRGTVLVLGDVFLYPSTGTRMHLGIAERFALVRAVSELAREAGFSFLTLEGYRKKPGRPARIVSVTRNLR